MSPVSVCASAAKKSIASAPLGTSADTASPYTLPTSRTSILASSSLCARSSRAARARTCARSCPLRSAHSFCATAAISTARSRTASSAGSIRGDHLACCRVDFIDCRGVAGKLFAADKRSADLHGALLLFEPPFHPDASRGATAKTQRDGCRHNLTLRRAAPCGRLELSQFRERTHDRGHRRYR